ncbi:MAG: SMP-30/gluconolactonase/LRE family protein [Acidimicrobiia bacterium]|nr:SMP-30/gluconolactonase/LRE family protein [Acidimicrobiia bacterium]
MRSKLVVAAALVAAGALVRAQSAPGPVIERRSPALDELIDPAAKPELLKGDYFGFLEGPVWVPAPDGGFLLFSDLAANRIYRWTPAGAELSVFLERSGYTGTGPSEALQLNNGRLELVLLGSNGLTLDTDGRLVFCAHGDRSLKRLEPDGTVTVLADRFEGRRFSGPNDVIVRSDGAIYFSDFFAGLRGADSPSRELPFFGLYLLKDGVLRVIDQDIGGAAPNGVALSADEKHLYVGAGPILYRYDVNGDGTVSNRQPFARLTLPDAGGIVDGIKLDQAGNVYARGAGGFWVLSPTGAVLGLIRATATNLAFGGADGRMLYITAGRDLYGLPVKTPGVRPMPKELRLPR